MICPICKTDKFIELSSFKNYACRYDSDLLNAWWHYWENVVIIKISIN